MAMGEGNVEFKKDDCEEWLHSVQAYRRKCASRRKAPAKPITCSSLLSLQLTQLEAGIESLPIKGLNAGIFMKGLNVLFGVAKSVLSFHLDPNLLKDTASLLKDVTTRVRAKFARACFTELAFIDRTVLACTTHTRAALVEEGQGTTIAETNGRLRDMMTLRDRHFVRHRNGRWEAKAAVAWGIADTLVGTRDRGVQHVDVRLVGALCTGKRSLLVSPSRAITHTVD